jgi:hypothetical protein
MKLDGTIGFRTQEEPSPNGIENDTLLRCRTGRARLYLAEPLTYLYSPVVSIRNSQGYWVGVLQLQTPLPHKNSDNSIHSEEMTACELVAISAGYAIGGLSSIAMVEWRLQEPPSVSDGERYEYYNVLWVEWRDGIAYRKGLGRVVKSAWEAQDLEWIDLVLG